VDAVEGLKPQQTMFRVADNISKSAFYIPAEDWTRKDGKDFGVGPVGERFGAFCSAVYFVTIFLEI
jgi:hypothetical protein